MAESYKPDHPYSTKCAECICGIENGRGIWCVRLKKIPTRTEIRRCSKFCPRVIIEGVDDY